MKSYAIKSILLIALLALIGTEGWGANYTVCSTGCTSTTVSGLLSGTDLNANDDVEIRADTPGGTKIFWNTGITWTSADEGSSGSPVTVHNRTGDTIILTGSYDTTGWATGWTNTSGTIYSRESIATEPQIAYYNTTRLTKNASTPTTPGSNEFGWAANVLYVNVGGDPASATAWRVGKNNYVLLDQANYVSFSGIQFDTANTTIGGAIYADRKAGMVFTDCIAKWSALHSIYVDLNADSASVTLTNITASGPASVASALRVRGGGAGSNIAVTGGDYSGGQSGISTTTAGPATGSITSASFHGQRTTPNQAVGIRIDHGAWTITSPNVYDIGDVNGTGVFGIYLGTASNTLTAPTITGVRGRGLMVAGDTNTVTGGTISLCGYMGVSETYPYSYPSELIKYGAGHDGGAVDIVTNASGNTLKGISIFQCTQGIGIRTTGGTGGNVIEYCLAKDYLCNGFGDYYDGNPANRNLFYNNTAYHSPSADNNPAYTGHAFHAQDISNGSVKVAFVNNIGYNALNNSASHSFFVSKNSGTVSVYVQNNDWCGVKNAIVGYLRGGTARAAISDWITDARASTIFGDMEGVQANAEAGTISADPLFISATDLRLKPGSPCINTGDNSVWASYGSDVTDYAGNPVADDTAVYSRWISGTQVDNVDIGAYNTVSDPLSISYGSSSWLTGKGGYFNASSPYVWSTSTTGYSLSASGTGHPNCDVTVSAKTRNPSITLTDGVGTAVTSTKQPGSGGGAFLWKR